MFFVWLSDASCFVFLVFQCFSPLGFFGVAEVFKQAGKQAGPYEMQVIYTKKNTCAIDKI